MLSAQEGLSALCVEVDVNDRGTFLFAEHDDRDSLSRPYGEGYRLVDEVVVVRDFLLHIVRERVHRKIFTSDRPRDTQVALRKGTHTETPIPRFVPKIASMMPTTTTNDGKAHPQPPPCCHSRLLCGAAELRWSVTLNCPFSDRLPPVSDLPFISNSRLFTSATLRIQPP